ncbi:MAG: hypothetical protein ACRD2Z_17130 [Thermoanaerobaculia bacterium]
MRNARSRVVHRLAACLIAAAVSHAGVGGEDPQGYQMLGGDLEPFRSAFNRASDHVRAVLLVAPT